MSLFQIDIEKSLGSEFWSNRWLVDVDGLPNAIVVGAFIVEGERAFHSVGVNFTRYRAASTAVGDGIFAITPIGETGERATGGALLPLFNTLRADLPAVSGRPSRKYWRGVLTEGDINGALVETDFSAFMDYFLGALAPEATNQIVDPQGQTLTDIVLHPYVQMRQLRRGRRRSQGLGIFP